MGFRGRSGSSICPSKRLDDHRLRGGIPTPWQIQWQAAAFYARVGIDARESSGILDYNKSSARLQSSSQPCRFIHMVVCPSRQEREKRTFFCSEHHPLNEKVLFIDTVSSHRLGRLSNQTRPPPATSSARMSSFIYSCVSGWHRPLAPARIMAMPKVSVDLATAGRIARVPCLTPSHKAWGSTTQ